MRETIEQYIRRCAPCQRRKEPGNYCPTWRRRGAQNSLPCYFDGYNGPYATMPRGNKYLLTFVDHLSKYVEAFPIPDHTADACTRV